MKKNKKINKYTINGKENYIIDANNDPISSNKLNIFIDGNNNIIKIKDTDKFYSQLNIHLEGSNNYIELGNDNRIHGDFTIVMGAGPQYHVENSCIIIGDNNGFLGLDNSQITIVNSNASVNIGNDCMIANGVMIYDTDGHPVYEYNDGEKGKLLNIGALHTKIGNHVWIGKDTTVLKGVSIPDDCIIGQNSVVTSKKFNESHCVIAGNPAKVVKTNRTWDVYDKAYVDNNINVSNDNIETYQKAYAEILQQQEKKAKSKKVVFDMSVLGSGYCHSEHRTGIYRVAKNALETLIKNPETDLYLTAFAQNDSECLEYIKNCIPKMRNRFFHTKNKFKLSSIFRKKFDICFSSYFNIPSTYRYNLWSKKIIIIYDLIQALHPEWVQKDCHKGYCNFLKRLTKQTIALCISEYTKKDLIEYKTKISNKNISTIPLGVDEKYHPNYKENEIKKIREKYGIGNKKYFFSISSMNPRKNFKETVLGFIEFIEKNNIDDIVLVLAGPEGWGEIFDGIDLKKYSKYIVFTCFAEEADLPLLYNGALASVYISLYEGFGLPPLESIYCNTPPIVSNLTSIPEVVGKAGILINPKNRNELVQAYETIYNQKFDMKAFFIEAQKQKEKFNWNNFAQVLTGAIK